MSDEIKGKEIIEDGYAKNSLQQTKELATAMLKLDDVIIKLTKDAAKLGKATGNEYIRT